MRSQMHKLRQSLERWERLEYKTERRIDMLKRNLAEIKALIVERKKELIAKEKANAGQ